MPCSRKEDPLNAAQRGQMTLAVETKMDSNGIAAVGGGAKNEGERLEIHATERATSPGIRIGRIPRALNKIPWRFRGKRMETILD